MMLKGFLVLNGGHVSDDGRVAGGTVVCRSECVVDALRIARVSVQRGFVVHEASGTIMSRQVPWKKGKQ